MASMFGEPVRYYNSNHNIHKVTIGENDKNDKTTKAGSKRKLQCTLVTTGSHSIQNEMNGVF